MKRFFFISVFVLLNAALFGQSAKQHVKTGEQFLANGLLDAAIEEFNQAILLEPGDGKTYQLKAGVLLSKEDTLSAAEHFRKAAALNADAEANFFKAGELYYSINKRDLSLECVNKGLEIKPKNFNLLLLKTRIQFEAGNFDASFNTANEAIKAKDQAVAFFYSGASARKLNNFEQANKDLEKAVIRDRNFSDAYLELAELQIDHEQYDYAIDNCSVVLLLLEPKNVKALRLRAKAFHAQRESEQAIVDITKAISLDINNWQLYMERAQYNLDYAHYSDAIDDYAIVLSLNETLLEAYKNRAFAYEQIGKNPDAREDYIVVLNMLQDSTENLELRNFAQEKIFELGREERRPEIKIEQPLLTTNYELNVKEDAESIVLRGTIAEETKLKSVTVNGFEIDPVKENELYSFATELSTEELDFVTISAIDIYDNVSTISYPIRLIETKSPKIVLISPAAGTTDAISLESGDNTLYIEGRVEDKSYITEIKVDEVNASFAPGDYNPRFTATIDIKNRQNLTITARDAFGNDTRQTYEFYKEGHMLSGNNPMGKTWVVIIENSSYKEFAGLHSPEKDIAELREALGGYKISKVLHKKNLSKRELERFFAIDLRDLIISNEVKSLLIWYAGHGQTVSNTGYWIPIDGRLNDEYSFYNINALKASLYSYGSLTHILVVSDACKAGESFAIAMRGDNTTASCDDARLVNQKSALVLTSSNTEPAMDNSLFTKTFINSLANNPADCIPVDAIAERISIVMYKHTAQKPVFGRISGLEDKNGTFFFMRKQIVN